MNIQNNNSDDEPLTSPEAARMLRGINRALGGDPLDPDKPGFISMFWELHRDYYGDKKSKSKGTKEKIEVLWEDRIKILAICGFIALVVGIIVQIFWKK